MAISKFFSDNFGEKEARDGGLVTLQYFRSLKAPFFLEEESMELYTFFKLFAGLFFEWVESYVSHSRRF